MHSRPSLRLSIAGISCALLVTARDAQAQNAEAEALFNEGDKLMAAGKTAEACDAFEASNRIESRAGTLIRLGDCREKNQQIASAWSAYKDALTRAKDPRKHDIAQAKASELEAKLSYLTVSVPDESRVDGLQLARNGKPLDPALWNRAAPVDGGQYIVVGRAPGHEDWQTTVTVPGEGGRVSVEVPKFKELRKLVAPPTPITTTTKRADGTELPEASPGVWTLRREIGVGVAGIGAAGMVAGAVLGLSAKNKQDQAQALCPDPQMACADAARATSLTHDGHRLAIDADVAFGVGVAAVAGAAVLWFTGAPESPRHVALVPVFAPGQSGIAVLAHF